MVWAVSKHLSVFQVHMSGEPGDPADLQSPTFLRCERLFNVVHAGDAISYFAAPLVQRSGVEGFALLASMPRADSEAGHQPVATRMQPAPAPTTPRLLPSSRGLAVGASPVEIAAFVREHDLKAEVDVMVPTRSSLLAVSELLNAPRCRVPHPDRPYPITPNHAPPHPIPSSPVHHTPPNPAPRHPPHLTTPQFT